MARTLRYLLVLLFTSVAGAAFAQSGYIYGTVLDAKKEPLVNATVIVTEGGIKKWAGITDFDGKYNAGGLAPGRFSVRISFTGYTTYLVSDVQVLPDQGVAVNATLTSNTELKEVVVTVKHIKPLINPTEPGSKSTLTAAEIEKMPTRNTAAMVSTQPGVYQGGRNGELSIGGGRSSNTVYIVDGILQTGSRATNLPPGSIGSISVYMGGLPARYGDATGGVVSITTKGVTSELRGSVGGEQSVDGFNNSRGYFNLSGPILKRMIDSVKTPVLGFTLNGDFQRQMDANPSYYENYVVKDDVLAGLQAHPLRAVPNQTGVPQPQYSSEFITMNDLTTQKRRVNADVTRGTLLGKLDYQLAPLVNLTLGAQFTGQKAKNYNRAYTLFAPEGIGTQNSYTARGYLRFTQRFANASSDSKNPISNAYYTVQADYQKEYTGSEDDRHKKDIFKYGYIGKFEQTQMPVYATGVDDSTGKAGMQLQNVTIPSSITFTRSELNPILANYTSDLYNLLGRVTLSDFNAIATAKGLTNGRFPVQTYTDRWLNVGQAPTGYNYSNNDQVSLGIDASFDFKPKETRHAIAFGLYYQQRTERFYALSQYLSGQNSLWYLARNLTNSHIYNSQNSLSRSPIFIVNGRRYSAGDVAAGLINPSPTDTILYERVANATQTTFDRSLRRKLGMSEGNTDYINVDALDPSQLSVDMFAADELLNAGISYVNYYGYDYKGNLQTGNVTFNDFFTKTDANGIKTRPIGAFRPNYVAGYIQDNFQFNKMLFNLGVRVDRYDANTKVLRDPYSLYASHTVASNDAKTANKAINNFSEGGRTPSNIGSNYVVYVENSTVASPRIVGYRNGDEWYDPYGRLVEDPLTLKNLYANGSNPQPFLQNSSLRITDSAYGNNEVNSSFRDYKAQVNVMPRISFSFPIADQSMFYAHYDVVVQRPRAGVAPSPIDYMFLSSRGNQIINNPDLKPERTIDYEVGFQQVLTKSSAITLSAFYRERKDQIQIRPYLYAWPNTYYTYGNRDFSTTKGLRVKYDFRRSGPLQMMLSYTLQFAEGTGSSAESSNGGSASSVSTNGLLQNFITNSLPNLRFPYALDYDSRHNIVLNLDYRYFDKGGPEIFGRRMLENAGANFIFRARSGEPYTRYADPVSNVVVGSVNGSRLPWHYGMDLNIDKDFPLNFGHKQEDGTTTAPRRPLFLNAFVYVSNLLNTREILGVYGFSGQPDDNGFLNSPQGASILNNQTNLQSYMDLYTIRTIDPNNVNLPRQINVGVRVNF